MLSRDLKKFGACAVALMFAISNTYAGVVDLADAPLVANTGDPVRPNVHFIFDDSLSMPQAWMPDSVNNSNTRPCFRNHGFNKVYFNPYVEYKPPVGANGDSFPPATFGAARPDGFNTDARWPRGSNNWDSTVNLNNNFRAGGSFNYSNSRYGSHADASGRAAYYYEYVGGGGFTAENPPETCAQDNRYELRTVTAAQQQNFANWFTYYRDRLLMMKSASGLAFAGVGDRYRVGFSTTSESGGANASRFLGNATFDSLHKAAWYDLLYSTRGDFAGTPLRGSLSRVGRYYAGTLSGAMAGSLNDPVQYSCQRNFAILTTDGFWNTSGESTSGTRFGPYRQDNSTPVGDQDGGLDPPYRDAYNRANTLADIAMYYYNTDLRTSGNGGRTDEGGHVNVAGAGSHLVQNMYTFTLGLGVTDSLSYPSDLPPIGSPGRAGSPIMQGTKHWPSPGISANGTVDGGTTVAGRTDDLWHAAENGRGRYISAANADQVVIGLNAALADIEANVGSSAAAATSNLQPVQDDNTAFVAQFETVSWVGNLIARTIDVNSGVLSEAPLWESKTEIDAQFQDGASGRNIYTFDATASNKRRDFRYDNLTPSERAWLNPASLSLPQKIDWDTTQQGLATSEAMVNYLRGDRTLEGNIFRERESLLGDIVNAAPVYVRKPPFSYLDPDYLAFANSNAARPATVYVGANDGMLHAIDADTGRERWAYMPSMVLENLWHLAREDYATNHRFYVDGPITVGDVYDAYESAWKTVLVGGLGKGGRGFYALDVTNPANPSVLWEFSVAQDADLGYSFGNPIITKRARDGRWVVILSSGYNNDSPGDSRGRLYVINATTGVVEDEYVTATTNDADLSGIGRASNLVSNGMQNNTTQYVYAGDLRGSLWRFDINVNSGATPAVGFSSAGVQRLGQTHSDPGVQPITVRPELARIQAGGVTYTVVYFGTGRFLGKTDVDDHPSAEAVQAIYAVKDAGADRGTFGNPGSAALIEHTMVINTPPLAEGQKEREIESLTPVNWSTDNGWFVNVPVGERFNVNPGLQAGVVVMAANIAVVPNRDRCNPQGAAVLYQLDYRTGSILRSDELSSMVVGFTQLQLGGGSGGPIVINVVQADGSTRTFDQENPGGVTGSAIRVGWRELE